MNESVDIMYDKRLFSKEVIRNVNYKEEKLWTSLSNADLYNLLHIVNESVDIMYDKRLFSKEVIRNVNYKGRKRLA